MAQQFKDRVEILDSSSNVILALDPSDASLSVGGSSKDGQIVVQDGVGNTVVELKGGTAAMTLGSNTTAGSIVVRASDGTSVINLDGSTSTLELGADGKYGVLSVRDKSVERVRIDGGQGNIYLNNDSGETVGAVGRHKAYFGGGGENGIFEVRTSDGTSVMKLNGGTGTVEIGREGLYGKLSVRGTVEIGGDGLIGKLSVRDASVERVTINGLTGDIYFWSENGSSVGSLLGHKAYWGGNGFGGKIELKNSIDRTTLELNGDDSKLALNSSLGYTRLELNANEGKLELKNSLSLTTVVLNGTDGKLEIKNSAGETTLELNGETGDITFKNADFAEDFDVGGTNLTIEPGTVVELTDDGTVGASQTAYSARAVGVVAGGGPYRPGIVMDRRNTASNRVPVALIGKTLCKVDATNGAIRVGDILTTSHTAGHAMRAGTPAEAFGAVIGKALAPLSDGIGLIPILVSLQ